MTLFETARFRAMGTDIEILGSPELPAHLTESVRALFQSVESRLSRFLPNSELSRLNRSGGCPFQMTPMLSEVVRDALRAARLSGGLFDPTMLDPVEASGYDRSFDGLSEPTRRNGRPVSFGHELVELMPGERAVLRGGVRIDLGGFAKGWAVDRAAAVMSGVGSWIVNAGGDLRTAGSGPGGDGWTIGIEDPWKPETDLAIIRVRDCAVATSSVRRRRWRTPDGWAHHLIDPRTGKPADTGLASVTVIAPSTARAEVLAKTVLLLGEKAGRRHVESLPWCAAVMVSDRGDVVWSDGAEALRAA